MSELHQLTVDSVDEDGIATFHITHCPQTNLCAVWHECKVDDCRPTNDDAEVDGDYPHGLEHRMIEDSWMSRDDPHNCGVEYADEWEGLGSPGDYVFDVDYTENGTWWPVGMTKIKKEADQ